MSTASQPASSAWAGWVVFAAAVLLVICSFNAIQGLVALFEEDVFVIAGTDLVVTTSYTTWGIALLIWGGVMVLAGIGLFSGAEWARWFGIVVVFVNLVGQFAWFSAFPLWSLTIIALNTAVLFALTARWSEAKPLLRMQPARWVRPGRRGAGRGVRTL